MEWLKKSEVKFKKNLSCQKKGRTFENTTICFPSYLCNQISSPMYHLQSDSFYSKNKYWRDSRPNVALFWGQSTLLASLSVLLSYQIWTKAWRNEGSWHLQCWAAALPPCSKSLCIPSMAPAGVMLWCTAWAGQDAWCVMDLTCPACTSPAASAGVLQASLQAAGKGL